MLTHIAFGVRKFLDLHHAVAVLGAVGLEGMGDRLGHLRMGDDILGLIYDGLRRRRLVELVRYGSILRLEGLLLVPNALPQLLLPRLSGLFCLAVCVTGPVGCGRRLIESGLCGCDGFLGRCDGGDRLIDGALRLPVGLRQLRRRSRTRARAS